MLPDRIRQLGNFFLIEFLAGLFPVGSDLFQGEDDRFATILCGILHKNRIQPFSQAAFFLQNVSLSLSSNRFC